MSNNIFYNPQTTLLDHPNKVSLIVYTNKCNWSCFGCHNMRRLAKIDSKLAISTKEVIEKLNSNLIDLLIISGGESLLLDDILVNELKEIRKESKKPIRIDTNGSLPKMVNYLKEKKLVDGFAVDVKYPYWIGDSKLEQIITGCNCVDNESILKTMSLVDGMPYTIFRTVSYPMMPKELIKGIRSYMLENFKSSHYINPYYTI